MFEGLATSPSTVSQIPGKYLGFLLRKTSDQIVVDPEHVVSALTRLSNFLQERQLIEISRPIFDPERIRLNSRDLYAIIPVIFTRCYPSKIIQDHPYKIIPVGSTRKRADCFITETARTFPELDSRLSLITTSISAKIYCKKID